MNDFKGWTNLAAQQRLIDTALIDGEPCQAQNGARFDVINPATNRVLARVAACGQTEVDQAVCSARRAFEQGPWAKMA
ncbi:MAG: aldehyde dehydrogenase family protein, partial [Pseudomonas sp.]